MLSKSCISVFSLFPAILFSAAVQAVNPNTASVEELADELIGVGPKLAEKIVKFREQNGEFQSLEDLMQVQGIANSVIEKNKNQIEFDN